MQPSRFVAALGRAAVLAAAGIPAVAVAGTAPPLAVAQATYGPAPATSTVPSPSAPVRPSPALTPAGPSATATPAAPSAAPAMTMIPRPEPPAETIRPLPITSAPPPLPGMPGRNLPPPVGFPALAARHLRAARTAAGYTLTGEAYVRDPCQAARFDPSLLTVYPPQFNLVQFRRPGSLGVMCIQRLVWVLVPPRTVASHRPPAYVTVHTQSRTYRVPIR